MDTKAQITIRTKKLGVLIRDARLSRRRSIEECATATGVSKGVFRSYEQGRKAPSLPELEMLMYFLDVPTDHFWGKEALSDNVPPSEPLDLGKLMPLRQRMIGALLRQERTNAGLSMKLLAEQADMPLSRLKAYELGERPMPLSELEGLLSVLGGRVEAFFDQGGPVGQWMARQRTTQDFLQLPAELQAFVCQPVNLPYLELARKLSELSTERLRSVAEGLLDITF